MATTWSIEKIDPVELWANLGREGGSRKGKVEREKLKGERGKLKGKSRKLKVEREKENLISTCWGNAESTSSNSIRDSSTDYDLSAH